MVWYGMMLKDGQPDRFAEARRAVNNLWDTFQVRKNGEWGINLLGQQAYRLQDFGIDIGRSTRAVFLGLAAAPRQWSAAESLIAPMLDFGEVRPEFMTLPAYSAPASLNFPASKNVSSRSRGQELLRLLDRRERDLERRLRSVLTVHKEGRGD